MNVLTMVKGGIAMATAYGTEQIISNVVKSTMPAEVSKPAEVCMKLAGYVIGVTVGKQVGDWAGELCDSLESIAKLAMEATQKEETVE